MADLESLKKHAKAMGFTVDVGYGIKEDSNDKVPLIKLTHEDGRVEVCAGNTMQEAIDSASMSVTVEDLRQQAEWAHERDEREEAEADRIENESMAELGRFVVDCEDFKMLVRTKRHDNGEYTLAVHDHDVGQVFTAKNRDLSSLVEMARSTLDLDD